MTAPPTQTTETEESTIDRQIVQKLCHGKAPLHSEQLAREKEELLMGVTTSTVAMVTDLHVYDVHEILLKVSYL